MFRITSFVLSSALLALTAAACSQEGHDDHSGHDHAPSPKSDTTPAAKPYPLATCVVSGEKLGEMGEVRRIVHEGQEIKFCCPGCEKDFNKDPQRYLRMITGSR